LSIGENNVLNHIL